MTAIELTPEELQLTRSALNAFLDDFGHEEVDVVRRIQAPGKAARGDLAAGSVIARS